jgi:multiple sugar transport system substrate-binding protein
MKRTGLFLAFIALAVLVFSACTPRGDPNYLRYAWWGNNTRDERTVAVTQLFMEQNPGITIETEPTGWAGYWTKLNTQRVARSLPDIMQQDYAYIEQYNTQLLDMTPFVDNGIIDVSDWPQSGIDLGMMDGRLIGLSMGINAWGMGVDPEVLRNAGITINDVTWTWRDYEEIALTIFQRTGVQTTPFNEFHQTFEHVVRQFGVGFYDGNTISITNNTDARDAIRELLHMQLRLRAAGALYDPDDAFIMGRAMEESPLARGRTWNNFHWSNQHQGHANAAGRTLEFILFPTVNGNNGPYFGTYLKPSMYISILSTATNAELAARFVNFILNDIEANRILLAERGSPVPNHIREDLSGLVDPGMKYIFDFITRITPYTGQIDPPDPAAAGEVVHVMRPIIQQCLMGRLPIEAAMTQMIQDANAVLGR